MWFPQSYPRARSARWRRAWLVHRPAARRRGSVGRGGAGGNRPWQGRARTGVAARLPVSLRGSRAARGAKARPASGGRGRSVDHRWAALSVARPTACTNTNGLVQSCSLHAARYEHGWKTPRPLPEPPMPARATRAVRVRCTVTSTRFARRATCCTLPGAPAPGLGGVGLGGPGLDSSRPGSPTEADRPRGRSDPNVVGLVSRRFRRPAGATNPGGAARRAMESIVVQERRRAAQHV